MTHPGAAFSDVKKILICQQRQIGDVLLASPAAELLNRRFPEAEIHFFCEKKCAPVLENNPYLSRIWVLDKSKHTNLFREIRFYRTIAAQEFDVVVDFQQLPRCRWIVLFSRSRIRLSYRPAWYKRWLYTHWTKAEPGYVVASKMSLLSPLGVSWQGELPRIYLTDEEKKQGKEILHSLGWKAGQILITVDPTHKRQTRRWPGEYFSRLLSLAVRDYPDIRFLFLYGPGEEKTVKDIAEAVSSPEHCLLPDRVLSLRETSACMARASLHLGTCSAPRHMAMALGTPTLTIMGSTSPTSWTCPAPGHESVTLDLGCRPCEKDVCPSPRCLSELTPETVYVRFRSALGEWNNGR